MDRTLRPRAIAAREELGAGRLRGSALADLLHAVPYIERDAFVDEMLGLEPPPPDIDLPRGAVPYLPCPVAEILDLVHGVPLRAGDVLVDLGAGIGRVLVLAHVLSGAAAHGIELQPHLVERARELVARLGLERVTCDAADFTRVPLEGTVFFLYAPCNGAMLAALVDQLAAVARRHPIVVACTAGVDLGDVDWLVARPLADRSLTIYDSR